MNIGRHRISNWWLLLVPILAVVGLPAYLLLNALAGSILGPPAIWNRTVQSPPRADLVGNYSGHFSSFDNPSTPRYASLSLKADGTMEVRGLPYEFYPMTCTISGKGRWDGPSGDTYDQKLGLDYVSDGATGSCASGGYELIELAGHAPPYKLYWIYSDPDSGTGVWMTWDK